MATKNTLEMVFQNTANNQVVFTLADPRPNVTKAEGDTAAALIIAKNIFITSGGELLRHMESRIRVVTVTELA